MVKYINDMGGLNAIVKVKLMKKKRKKKASLCIGSETHDKVLVLYT